MFVNLALASLALTTAALATPVGLPGAPVPVAPPSVKRAVLASANFDLGAMSGGERIPPPTDTFRAPVPVASQSKDGVQRQAKGNANLDLGATFAASGGIPSRPDAPRGLSVPNVPQDPKFPPGGAQVPKIPQGGVQRQTEQAKETASLNIGASAASSGGPGGIPSPDDAPCGASVPDVPQGGAQVPKVPQGGVQRPTEQAKEKVNFDAGASAATSSRTEGFPSPPDAPRGASVPNVPQGGAQVPKVPQGAVQKGVGASQADQAKENFAIDPKNWFHDCSVYKSINNQGGPDEISDSQFYNPKVPMGGLQ